MCENHDHSHRSDVMPYVYLIVLTLVVGVVLLFGDRFNHHPAPIPDTHVDAGVR